MTLCELCGEHEGEACPWAVFIANRYVNDIRGILRKKGLTTKIFAKIPKDNIDGTIILFMFYKRMISNTLFKELYSNHLERFR